MYHETRPTAARNISKKIMSTLANPADERMPFVDNACRLLIESRFGAGYSWTGLTNFMIDPEAENTSAVEKVDCGLMSWYSLKMLKEIFGVRISQFLPSVNSAANYLAEIRGTHFSRQSSGLNAAIRPPPRSDRKILLPVGKKLLADRDKTLVMIRSGLDL
ncbi:hypothetical protein BH10ACI2_BH10ACI2_11070 [soil metagenome]